MTPFYELAMNAKQMIEEVVRGAKASDVVENAHAGMIRRFDALLAGNPNGSGKLQKLAERTDPDNWSPSQDEEFLHSSEDLESYYQRKFGKRHGHVEGAESVGIVTNVAADERGMDVVTITFHPSAPSGIRMGSSVRVQIL